MNPISLYLQRFRQARFLAISIWIHIFLVALLGGVVLFKAALPPDTFETSVGGFIEQGNQVEEEVIESGTGDFEDESTPVAELPDAQTSASAITSLVNNISISAPPPVAIQSSGAVLNTVLTPTVTDRTGSSSSAAGARLGTLAGRTGSARGTLLKQNGGKQDTEKAVLAGLRWLQKQQKSDGSWGESYRGALTGLALLAFLGHGETPRESVEFGATVSKAIEIHVKEGARNQGNLSMNDRTIIAGQENPYQQGIAAYALAEALAMTQDEKITPVLLLAVEQIVKGQRPDGGWAYGFSLTPDTPTGKIQSDTSVSGWQIQALKTAKLAGLKHDGIHPALEKAIKNLERVFFEKDGTFGYRSAGDNGENAGGMTAIGVLCTFFIEGKAGKMTRAGLNYILDRPKLNFKDAENTQSFYSWYYMTQACFQGQGSAWSCWNSMFQDQLLQNQNGDGSWPAMATVRNHDLKSPELDAAIYRTALAVLMLEVYYRYSPVSKLAPQG